MGGGAGGEGILFRRVAEPFYRVRTFFLVGGGGSGSAALSLYGTGVKPCFQETVLWHFKGLK